MSKELDLYVKGSELRKELSIFKTTGVQTEKLGAFIYIMVHKYALKPRFNRYTNAYKDEFIQDAILRVVEQLDKIDLDHPKCNPFAYITSIIHNSFHGRINKENRYLDLKRDLTDYCYDLVMSNEEIDSKASRDEIF